MNGHGVRWTSRRDVVMSTQHPTKALSLTISGRRGVWMAMVLLWNSLVAVVRRTSVTFEVFEDA